MQLTFSSIAGLNLYPVLSIDWMKPCKSETESDPCYLVCLSWKENISHNELLLKLFFDLDAWTVIKEL